MEVARDSSRGQRECRLNAGANANAGWPPISQVSAKADARHGQRESPRIPRPDAWIALPTIDYMPPSVRRWQQPPPYAHPPAEGFVAKTALRSVAYRQAGGGVQARPEVEPRTVLLGT